MKVLSLFDGMACAALALQKAGVPIEEYNAFEIDKYAIQTSSYNFPFIKHYGDVFGADFTQFRGCDILMGGSPCTYWSIAQKNNRETEASGLGWELFSQYVRALKEAEPRYFVYENNKSMSNAIKESISEAFGFPPIMINSALVSAQNRQRLYWVGRRNNEGGYDKVDVKLPEDRGILLRDILESGIVDREKAYALKHQAGNARDYLKKHHTQVAFEPYCVAERGRYADTVSRNVKGDGPVEQYYEAREDGKTNAVTTVSKDNYVAEPVRIGDIGTTAQAHRVYSCDGKSVNITSNGGGQGAKTGLYLCPVGSDDKRIPIYEVKNGYITHNGKEYPIKLIDGFYIIRKLTVRECMRLQTVPEWFEFPVSNTQAYKMLGNGWTVDVIAWILGFIKECEK